MFWLAHKSTNGIWHLFGGRVYVLTTRRAGKGMCCTPDTEDLFWPRLMRLAGSLRPW